MCPYGVHSRLGCRPPRFLRPRPRFEVFLEVTDSKVTRFFLLLQTAHHYAAFKRTWNQGGQFRGIDIDPAIAICTRTRATSIRERARPAREFVTQCLVPLSLEATMESGSRTIQASGVTWRPQPSRTFTIPDPIAVPDWSSEILRSAPPNGLAQAWPRSSFSADSPEGAATSKAASRRNYPSSGRAADGRFGRKRPEKDETSTHDSYSSQNSTNWLGPLVIKNGARISAIEDLEGRLLWQPLRSFALMSIFTIC